MPSGIPRGDRDQIPFLPEPKQSQPMNPHVSSSLLPTQLLDRRVRTSLSIKEIAGGNNSTRVLSPLYPGANTSVLVSVASRMGISKIAIRAMDGWSLRTSRMDESNAALTSAHERGGRGLYGQQFGNHECDYQPEND